ncbi:hypothetical protein K443DRAFT_14303 [Laccaria amethystina LaAM-08-1]|uniref:Uncharacterized protein n=1 Tax=Laccaria amethystina LaAM-08-1 TaxID=1095629 RepID=A0A0C9X4Z4_9AGAR|nr:hypothetical protein K443DRAFT_14303 [Laccaria amethystina LaAM-08-1]
MPIVRGLENEAGDVGNIGGGYMRDSFDEIQLSPTVIMVVDNDVISPAALPAFHALYAALFKTRLSPLLSKRDKKRRMMEPIVVEGPKRGNGRRKRQRLVKAVRKQEASQRAAVARAGEDKRKRERV